MKYLCLFLFSIYCSAGATSIKATITDGYYQIVVGNKSINIPNASYEIGKALIVWNKYDCRFNQEWKFESVGKFYIIRSRMNGLVISANGNTVQQKPFNGDFSQLWQLERKKNAFNLISHESGMALTISSDTNNLELMLSELKSEDTQLWSFEPAGLEYIDAGFNKIVSPDDMKADLDYFFIKLHEVHVNPYAFVSKDSLDQRIALVYNAIKTPLKRYEFNRLISQLNGMFDGHSGIKEIDWERYNRYADSYGGLFPYNICYTGNAIYIKSEIDSLQNLEIIAINDIAVNKICTEIEKRVNLENRKHKNTKVESNFRIYLMGLFDIESPFKLLVKDANSGKTKIIVAVGIQDYKFQENKENKKEPYAFREYKSDSIAIIEYNTCRISNPYLFSIFVDSVFEVVKKEGITNLFIDISRNGGGSSSNNEVFYSNINHYPNPWNEEYVKKISIDAKMHTLGFGLYNTNEPFDVRFVKYELAIKSNNLIPWKAEIINLNEGEFYHDTVIFCNEKTVDGYAGNLFIIQSHFTYSAACDMAAWFKYGKVGTLIGSETGGTTKVYIESLLFNMPNSNISFKIADNYCSFPNGDLKRGILPDINLGENFYKTTYELDDLKGFLKK